MGISKTVKIMNISNKPLNFIIAHDPPLFRDKYYHNVSYRLVVLHAMQHYFLSKKGSKDAKSLLEDLKNATQTSSDGYYEPGFLELYQFKKIKENGLVLIDRSKGCYPLVLYPTDDNPAHGSRVWTFQQMLDDLLLSHKKYDDLLKTHTTWNAQLVDQLRSTFTFPEKKQDDFLQQDDSNVG